MRSVASPFDSESIKNSLGILLHAVCFPENAGNMALVDLQRGGGDIALLLCLGLFMALASRPADFLYGQRSIPTLRQAFLNAVMLRPCSPKTQVSSLLPEAHPPKHANRTSIPLSASLPLFFCLCLCPDLPLSLFSHCICFKASKFGKAPYQQVCCVFQWEVEERHDSLFCQYNGVIGGTRLLPSSPPAHNQNRPESGTDTADRR